MFLEVISELELVDRNLDVHSISDGPNCEENTDAKYYDSSLGQPR